MGHPQKTRFSFHGDKDLNSDSIEPQPVVTKAIIHTSQVTHAGSINIKINARVFISFRHKSFSIFWSL